MAYLPYISDENLEKHIKKTLLTYRETLKKIDLESFNSNIIDPIKLTFDSIVYNKKVKKIIAEEIVRQRDKTNSNEIGDFHQKIFQYFDNCDIQQDGFDIIYNGEHKVYVELKNKHNTMNSSSAKSTYLKMQDKLLKDPKCECYLVEVIAKKSQNIVWKVSVDGKSMSNERIHRLSIDKFYELVTGDKNAFVNLCKVLPQIIKKIVKETLADKREKDTVFAELKKHDSDLLKALYLLAFKTYEGFDSF